MKRCLAIGSLALLASPLLAATRATTMKVPGMTCPTCPITVKKALARVPGVSKVAVDYPHKKITVTFDDGKTNDQALLKTLSSIGFPAEPVKAAK